MAKMNWHKQHREHLTAGQRVADSTARVLGSWTFIIIQTALVTAWIVLNLIAWARHWDPYPFILLNLMFSVQAAYAGPILMMSQNRQSERDRFQAQADYDTNVKGEQLAEEILERLRRMEEEHLPQIRAALESDSPK
ncbi:MAG: hypothetical protein CVT67_03930 [Actinobacteria bacterium HGW-Actinobacteria-7]|jgi:uncharacterized membrane protein|nr:MAG: hypothetical protein CVT67_03930 [Actinobacteria bacterium HGW-Actinobacteria-7]